MNFAESLQRGQQMGEGPIACWLMTKGSSILPVYEKQVNSGKGPQLFTATGSHVAPDLMAFTRFGGPIFVEAKHKSVFTWHRNTGQWTTGIDLNHYEHYLQVQAKTQLPVWLFFLHSQSTPDMKDKKWGCPETCPSGLFANDLSVLAAQENHRSPALNFGRHECLGHGNHGMVYWAESALHKVATADEVFDAAFNYGRAMPARLVAAEPGDWRAAK